MDSNKDTPAFAPHLTVGAFPEPGQISGAPVIDVPKVVEPALPATTLEKPKTKKEGGFKGLMRALTLGVLFGGAADVATTPTVQAERPTTEVKNGQDVAFAVPPTSTPGISEAPLTGVITDTGVVSTGVPEPVVAPKRGLFSFLHKK
jgi:hypothetical protein